MGYAYGREEVKYDSAQVKKLEGMIATLRAELADTRNERDEAKRGWWHSACSGCPNGHPSFWKTVIESPQWKEWARRPSTNANFDIAEVEECGWISQAHFQEFIHWTIKSKLDKIVKDISYNIEGL